MLPRWWVGGCWPRKSRDGEGRLEDGTRTGLGHEHWACWEPLEGGWQGGAGATGGHGKGHVGTGRQVGRWAQPVMGAGQATQAWPAGQVSRKMKVLEGRGEHLLRLLGRRLHACRQLGCRGPRVRRDRPQDGVSWGRTAHRAMRVAPVCDRRASGAGGGQGHPELGSSETRC